LWDKCGLTIRRAAASHRLISSHFAAGADYFGLTAGQHLGDNATPFPQRDPEKANR